MGSNDEYRRALESAIREYHDLVSKKGEIDTRLAQLKETIATLTRLCGYTPTAIWGLTEACRVVLRNAARAMTPIEVRDRLIAVGFPVSEYSNLLASVHTVLKRLTTAGEARLIPAPRGKGTYFWVAPPHTALLTKSEIDALLKERAETKTPKARRPKEEPKEE